MKRFDELGLGSAFAIPKSLRMFEDMQSKLLPDMSKIAGSLTLFDGIQKTQERLNRQLGGFSALGKVNHGLGAFMPGQSALATLSEGIAGSHKLLGLSPLLRQMEDSARTATALGMLPSASLGAFSRTLRTPDLGRIFGSNSLSEMMLGISSKYALLGASPFGKALFPDLGDRYAFLRTVAAGTQAVDWMRPLAPAMVSLAELAEEEVHDNEDWAKRFREILTALVQAASKENLGLLLSIFSVIWSFIPNPQLQELSDQSRSEFRQLREDLQANRLGSELNHEQLLELQLQVLRAAASANSEYIATVETEVRIRTNRSKRAHSLGTLGPGDPVIVLALEGRWAYAEAEIETGHVVGWLPKKSLSKPRRALLPDLMRADGALDGAGGVGPN